MLNTAVGEEFMVNSILRIKDALETWVEVGSEPIKGEIAVLRH
jgi:hypothetical protein